MLDLTKKYRTRDGREVRGLHASPDGASIGGWVKHDYGDEFSVHWYGVSWNSKDGRASGRPDDLDLIPVPEVKWERWLSPVSASQCEPFYMHGERKRESTIRIWCDENDELHIERVE